MTDRIRPIDEKSVNELEGIAPAKTAQLPAAVVAARAVPLNQLTPEQCLLLLEREYASRYVVRRAMAVLEGDPWLRCYSHDGDLLLVIAHLERGSLPPGEEWIERRRRLVSDALLTAPQRYDFERDSRAERELEELLPHL